jgi:hypothetical protein
MAVSSSVSELPAASQEGTAFMQLAIIYFPTLSAAQITSVEL